MAVGEQRGEGRSAQQMSGEAMRDGSGVVRIWSDQPSRMRGGFTGHSRPVTAIRRSAGGEVWPSKAGCTSLWVSRAPSLPLSVSSQQAVPGSRRFVLPRPAFPKPDKLVRCAS